MKMSALLPWEWRKGAAPQELLPLWTISEEGFVISTRGGYAAVYSLEGIDATHLSSEELARAAQGFYTFFGRAEQGLRLQFLQHSHSDQAELFRALEENKECDNEVLNLQQKTQTQFLRAAEPRAVDQYLVVSLGQMEGEEFQQLSQEEHAAKLKQIRTGATKVLNGLKEAFENRDSKRHSLVGRRLNAAAVTVLFRKLLAPGHKGTHSEHLNYNSSARSIRGQLFTENIHWDQESLRLGGTHVRVLSLLGLKRPTTEFASAEIYLDQAYDYLLSYTVEVPKQSALRQAATFLKNTAYGTALEKGSLGDEASEGTFAQMRGLLSELSDETSQLVTVTAQVALYGPNRNTLEGAEDKFTTAAGEKLEATWVSEVDGHHRRYFELMPGMSGYSDRKLVVTSRNAVDMAPLCGLNRGDRRPVLVYFSTRDTPVAYDPMCAKRPSRNGFIVGDSGSGKSVAVNQQLLASCMYHPETRGKTLVIDNAGADASSYRQVADLVGGDYVEVMDSDFGINPFPKALTEKNVKSLIGLILLVLQSEKEGRNRQLEELVVLKSLQALYHRQNQVGEERPTFRDFLDALRAAVTALPNQEEKACAQLLTKTLTRELQLGNMEVFLRPTKAQEVDLRILDLKGLQRLRDYIQGAIVYAVCNVAWELMLEEFADTVPPRYVILDEVAQLVRVPEVKTLISELYATARKHNGSVWGITQQYQDFRKSGLVSSLVGNSTTQLIMQSADSSQIAMMAQDMELTPRECEIIKGLNFKKGQFSEALLRTSHYNEVTRESLKQSTKVRLKLSPYTLACTTSDPVDRQRRLQVQARYPQTPLYKVMAVLAHGGVGA